MTRARFVLLNGAPGAGKSTVAAWYVAQHPGALRLEADLLRPLIGGSRESTAAPARALSLAMASAHLATGHDVIAPQLVAVLREVERFRSVADAAGAEFIELQIDPGEDLSGVYARLVEQLRAVTPRVDRSIDQRVATPLTWAELVRRLAPVRSYWLSTTGRSGAPQVAPVWGAVLDDTLYLYSERDTAKARNLADDPRVALHLADAEDVLIVHGEVEDLGLPTGRPEVMDAFRAKYVAPGDAAYLPDADPEFDVLWALRPARALTWLLESFEGSRRRWTRPL